MPLPPVAPSPTPTTLEISTPSASTASSFPPPLAAFGDCAYSPPAAMRSQNGGLCLPITHQVQLLLARGRRPGHDQGTISSSRETDLANHDHNAKFSSELGVKVVDGRTFGRLQCRRCEQQLMSLLGSQASTRSTRGRSGRSYGQPFYRIFDAYCWPGYFVTGVDMHVSVTCSIRRLWLISSLCTYYEAQLRSAI